jgi:hypothetical protein
MNPFNMLLVGAVIWGVTLALAFISGIAVGNSQEVAAPASSVAQPIGADGQQGQFDPAARDEFRQRVQSGEATQEEIDQFRQRFQQGGGQRGQFGGQRPGGQEGTTPGTGTGPRTGTN